MKSRNRSAGSQKTPQVEYYTVKEAAEMLKMHPNEVRRAIVEHRLGAFRKGYNGSYLITLKQIDAFLVPAGADWSRRLVQVLRNAAVVNQDDVNL